MPLNAPALPPEHPINRVTVNFACPKCQIADGLSKALQYGDGDKFSGKVYHFCAATPACKGVRCYTPAPLHGAQAPPAPPPHYPMYYPPAPGFPAAGFAAHPAGAAGAQPGHAQPGAVVPHPFMGWGFPPGYPPPFPVPGWPPPAHAAPAHAAAAQPPPPPTRCPGPLCRQKAPNERTGNVNHACSLKVCKNCCQATLLEDERALRPHEGCKTHKRDPFRPGGDPNDPARPASPPIDPVLRQEAAQQDAGAAREGGAPAGTPQPAARPGIGRSLDLTWAALSEAQTQQQLALGTRRRQATMSKMHRVIVIIWHADELPYRRFEVPVTSLACFSLDTDASDFLLTAQITATMFERFDLSVREWTMVKREATMPVLALQHLLFRVFGVTKCVNFAKAVELATASPTGTRLAQPSPKRLREAPTSPPLSKRVRLSPVPENATDHAVSPAFFPEDSSSDESPPVTKEAGTTTTLKILRPNQTFPADFFFCDVVNALKDSVPLARARKKQRDGRPSKRFEVLSELLQTPIPPSTLGDVERKVKAVETDKPETYATLMRHGHTEAGLYKNLTASSRASSSRAAGASSSRSRRSPSSRPASRRSSSKSASSARPPATPSSSTRVTRSSSGSAAAPSASRTQNTAADAIEILSSSSDQDNDSDTSYAPEPLSPLTRRIGELEEEQEQLRPAPPIDIELLPTTIDWNDVARRAERLLPKLMKIIDDPDRHAFCQELCRALRARRDKKQLSLKQRWLVSELVHAGYYGPNGLGLAMAVTIELKNVQLYSDDALKKIRPLRTEMFVERVLVRELILELMKEDFSLNDEDTALLYERTKWVGERNHPLPPDRGVEPTSAADFWYIRRASERRRELEKEEIEEEQVHVD